MRVFAAAVSRRPTETQVLTITGCCVAAWTGAASEHATVGRKKEKKNLLFFLVF